MTTTRLAVQRGRLDFMTELCVDTALRSTPSRTDSYASAAASCACNSLRKASRAVTQLFDQTLEPTGLRSTQFVILLEIAIAEHTTVPQLARRLVLDRSTLHRNVQPLVRRGLIRVSAGAARRSREMTLTPAGHRVVAAAIPLWDHAQTTFLQQFGRKRWRTMRDSLSAAVTAARGEGTPPDT